VSNKPRFQHPNNTGKLFKNTFKSAEDQPDYTGSAKIDNKEIDIGAWIRTDKNGQNYFAFKFQIIETKPESEPEPEPETTKSDIDNQIPF
jgi:hypothetical protein|tara:strand:- start:213 stop:482 length:270 start_codon:yes stop_codon:yes gene_type:complete